MRREHRWGMHFRPANMWLLTITVAVIVLGGAWLKLDNLLLGEITAAAVLLVMLVAMITWRSRTLLGWLGKRLNYKTTYEQIAVFEAANVGHTWDGRRVCVYIEILPQPYEVTVIGSEAETTIRPIPVDVIREELTQFDIKCDHVSVLTFAHKYDQPSKAATASHAALGPVAARLYGRTVLEVCVALDNSLDSVAARQGKNDETVGLSRTVTIAAERVRRRLRKLRWNVALLTGDDLDALQGFVGGQLEELVDHQRWGTCGASVMRSSVFTPASSAWTGVNYAEWLKVDTHRHLEVLRLTRLRDGRDHAELFLGYLADDPTALNTVRAIGLRREYGQQAAPLTAAIPARRSGPTTAVAGKTLAKSESFPVPLQAGGVGTFIGLTKTRAQVFVNFSVGTSPFYVVAPATLCQQLLLRLSTSGLSVDIDIPGEEWRLFARTIGVSYQQNPNADVIVSTQEGLKRQTRPHQSRLIWMTSEPRRIDYGIVAGPEECVLTTPSGQTRYRWLVSNAEENMFTLRPQPRPRHAAPPDAPRGQPPRPADLRQGGLRQANAQQRGQAPQPAGPGPERRR